MIIPLAVMVNAMVDGRGDWRGDGTAPAIAMGRGDVDRRSLPGEFAAINVVVTPVLPLPLLPLLLPVGGAVVATAAPAAAPNAMVTARFALLTVSHSFNMASIARANVTAASL